MVSDMVMEKRDKLRSKKLGQSEVKRYWPGKAPEWAADDDDHNDEDGDFRISRADAFPAQEQSFLDPVRKNDDPRLRRLAENRIDNREEIRADHRRIRQAEIISSHESSMEQESMDVDEEDEDALEERRRRIREKMLRRQAEDAALFPIQEEDDLEPEKEEESSEYETDSENDEPGCIAMIKPAFVPKPERDTIAERERLEEEQRAAEESTKRRSEEMRAAETKKLLVEMIHAEEKRVKDTDSEAIVVEDVDTDDDINGAEEYETWKAREIARIKRNREDSLKEKDEQIEKFRNVTGEERKEAGKSKWNFMQKYFHKGAFFQADADDRAGTAGTDNIYSRDFSAPTGQDKMDKTILPKVKQNKNFGRRGNSKWTHLVNEDTTDWSNPWSFSDPLRQRYYAKMAGMKPIAKPKGK
ncbi:OLC1v1009841C1 [Oldenlandia corymbosa var. corymbosa]|uniref:OLC1v1009841C1 n=1 Tax=Oldenlandia corymbosa var. corymbosa TaxID=529605 RepID=A0AAV1DPU6_OLDCO|nr:OLC1v1009841C1 [Oldenlandia corymbosa var. corymbosa]